jgi:DNA-directed RNA polymerase subunit M/transcription elongation factor TFIIS
MAHINWKWAIYNWKTGDCDSGEISSLSEISNESFWKSKWPRHKNAPKWIVDYSSNGVIIAGYKTRHGENTHAVEVIQTLIPSVKPQEIRRIRGNVMICRRVSCDEIHENQHTSSTDKEEVSVPDVLSDKDDFPMEYMVRCEGASDDNVNLVTLLEREGIHCGLDGEDTPGPLTFATVRNTVRKKLCKIIENPEMCRDIERGILEETIRKAYVFNIPRVWKNKVIKEVYQTLYAKVWRNLLPKSHPQSVGNPKLLSLVKTGVIDAKELGSMSPQKMWPERWRDLEESRILKQIATLERSAVASTDMFKCGRCGKNECTYREVQTRSADEPMTVFILCLVCGNRWKE